VFAAEGGTPHSPVLLVRRADLDGLGAADLRPGLDRLLCGPFADAGLDALLTTGLLEALLPEVEALVGFGDGEWRHKDVWRHTKQVIVQSVPSVELRWSALLHDIGKVKTRSIDADGQVHFHGHAEVGARMFSRLERRLQLFAAEQSLREQVHFLILHHLRASGYDSSWTDSAVRRFAREVGPHAERLLALSRADMTTKRPEKKRAALRRLAELEERMTALALEDARLPPLPTGVGEHLMREFNLPPCRLIGDIKRALEAACETGELTSGQSSEYYVDYVARHRDRFGLD
jgi:poly(A) polymerase